jgi:hypothetical protein
MTDGARDDGDRREHYAFVAHAALHPRDGVRVCAAVLDTLGTRLRAAVIDGYTDHEADLSPGARAAQTELLAFGAARGRSRFRDPGLGIELDLGDPRHRAWLDAYGPWSINVDLWSREGYRQDDLGQFHDCSDSIVATLSAPEAASLTASLGDLGQFRPLTEVRAERRRTRARKK